jgi:hypothetical protein
MMGMLRPTTIVMTKDAISSEMKGAVQAWRFTPTISSAKFS